MDECNLEFAREMVAAFGEDRFYHAVLRPTDRLSRFDWTSPASRTEAMVIFIALGGSKDRWESKCKDLRLMIPADKLSGGYKAEEMDEEEARKVLCRTAYILAKHHKEYALKNPELPSSIHARMILDSGNEWTKKYADVLEEFEG